MVTFILLYISSHLGISQKCQKKCSSYRLQSYGQLSLCVGNTYMNFCTIHLVANLVYLQKQKQTALGYRLLPHCSCDYSTSLDQPSQIFLPRSYNLAICAIITPVGTTTIHTTMQFGKRENSYLCDIICVAWERQLVYGKFI